MTLARRRWRWRQIEAVRTRMPYGQKTVVRIPAHLQLSVAWIDKDYLSQLPVPSHPPPLLTAVRRGDEREVTALMPRYEFTSEAISG
jgi:hypothetical protein